MQLTDR
jgi:hypothetical protein